MGYQEMIDIGSGDGRISYCGKILGLSSYSIEIDDSLTQLQETISSSTGIDFHPYCADALEFDYSSLLFSKPVFFIGGLSQMGGDVLANGIIQKISVNDELKKTTGFVFAGSHSKRLLSSNHSMGGWGSFIGKNNLQDDNTLLLPTVWTFDQEIDTPYIFTRFKQ